MGLTKMWTKKVWSALALVVLVAFSMIVPANAVCDPSLQSCSTSWGVGEYFWGTGGELNACSTGGTGYCAKMSAGETAVGNSLTSYANNVLQDSPVAFWRLGETSGTTAADSSGNGRNGTYTGSYTQGRPGLVNGTNKSATFNGANGDYVTIPGSSSAYNIETTDKLAVEFWYSGTDSGTGGAQTSGLVTANVDASNKQWAVGLESNGRVNAQIIRVAGIYDDNVGNAAINDGQRHHVVVNYNKTALTVDIYIDGTLDSNFTIPSLDSFGSPVVRIANNPRSDGIAGTFDEVAVYPDVLSATRIAQHYTAGALSYQANSGFNTNRNEYLEFTVNTASVNLGTISTSTTGTGTATFNVKSYLANGYQVVTSGGTPTNSGSYSISGMGTQAASSQGTEQFGINLKANTSPATFGADPVQQPDESFSYGYVATGYDTANQFKYVNGDVIAKSNKSSGTTDYTISYIMNINNSTRGGVYTMSHVLVATSTF